MRIAIPTNEYNKIGVITTAIKIEINKFAESDVARWSD